MEDVEKRAKYCREYAIVYLILDVLGILFGFSIGMILYFNIFAAILLLLCFIGSGKQLKYGPICGIIACIMMILTFNIIEIVFAIFLLINCIKLLRVL